MWIKKLNIMDYIKVKVNDIKWDTDGEEVELPKNLIMEIWHKELDDVNDDFELEEYISDTLSNMYGFCHFGFKFTRI